ncbi:flavodoxin domain-containing protein [Anaerorhabdus sp.]|uniref:flavodoxin domain-containing protein n=1 Tax=Anaerorhabdus sp. TaxID=1872524 RepID=UPI002FCA4399
MKKGIVVYGSHYGATEAYAREIAKRLEFDCMNYKEVKTLDPYQIVVIGGGLYAGGVTGLKKTVEKVDYSKMDIFIYTVGLSSKTKENLDHANLNVRSSVSKEQVDDSRIFYYRGNMDLHKLSFLHRTMMKFMISETKKIPTEKQTEDNKGVINLNNESVHFIDINDVSDLVEAIKQIKG